MRYPNHIIIDVVKLPSNDLTTNWTSSYHALINRSKHLNDTLNVINTVNIPSTSVLYLPTSTTIVHQSSSLGKKSSVRRSTKPTANSLLWSLFDINFLKKEKMYTKLKYSRSPQYDIVSGGVAALFAGFIGFLISEKFGIELVDSGDFYTFFMYIVFLCFATRPFLRIMSKKNTLYHFVSLKYLLQYLHTLVVLGFKFLLNFVILRLVKNINFQHIIKFLYNNEYFSFLFSKIGTLTSTLKNYPLKK